jgi:hypothetical protein
MVGYSRVGGAVRGCGGWLLQISVLQTRRTLIAFGVSSSVPRTREPKMPIGDDCWMMIFLGMENQCLSF